MPGSESLKAERSSMLKRKMKSVGARTHPCLIPLVTGNSLPLLLLTNLTFMPLWEHLICLLSWKGLRFGEVCSTVPGATLYWKPWWGQQRGCRDTYLVPLHFSWICRAVNIVSTVPLFWWKPPWLSGTVSSRRWVFNLLKMILEEDLACNTQKGGPITIVAVGFVTFAFIQMHFSGTFQILG